MRNEKINKANELLSKGKVEEVFELLENEKNSIDEAVFEDIIALKGKYNISKEDFQVRNIIASSDFNMERSRTVNGIQLILRKLQEGRDTPMPKKIQKPWVALIALLPLAIWGSYEFYQSKQPSHSAIPKNQHDFIGAWIAKVEKKSYLIDRGIKTFYEDAEAHWQINVMPDHNITLSGTKDTTNATSYTWFYSEVDSTITLIQKDRLAFKIHILERSPQKQLWRTTLENGNKTEEWNWTLTSK